jgi:hypothetical protein
VTEAVFGEMKRLWGNTNNIIGIEAGSIWVDSALSPGGVDFMPMTPAWGLKGNPTMEVSSDVFGYGAMAILHTHPQRYRPFGTGFPRATAYGSSGADRWLSDQYRIPNYIGTARGLLVYRPFAKEDEKLMGSSWWKKDCF